MDALEYLAKFAGQLSDLHGTTVEVTVRQQPADRPLTDDEADRIHEALLKKQRGGSLGLNE
jgi:hypothetical protein